MKKFNEVTLTRKFSDCRFEDVEDLIKYWDDHNYEGLINMKIEPEYSDGYPLGTFEVVFETSIGSCENRWWRTLGERMEDEMVIFFEDLDKRSE